MCGRYNLRSNLSLLAEEFAAIIGVPELRPRFNIAPTQQTLFIKLDDGQRVGTMGRWGLLPFWAKDTRSGPPLINARADTIREKPAFRAAFKSRRCLIPADGFYEWKKLDTKNKQTYHIRMRDERPFAFAGLWEVWEKEGAPVESCCIVTTEANSLMSKIHDRMPVILPRDAYYGWLNADSDTAAKLMTQYPAQLMEAIPVSSYVNKVANQGPECIVPV